METLLDWQKMFENYPYTGDLRSDLVGIAKTQVGYAESSLNFVTGGDGIRRGYTRYGAWYGTPYRDWSAMFVSFCLNYAGADPGQYPGNTGAASMAELWKQLGKYALAGTYVPKAGDLVFFTDNTVGIVTDVYNATFYVIRGDIDDAVRGGLMFLGDASISGWGVMEGTATNNAKPPGAAQFGQDPLDISNGPAIFIYEDGEAPGQVQRYSLRRSARTVADLIPYLEANGGSYFFTLLDKNNQELPKDEAGHYIAIAQTGYKLTISFTSPEGFLPGTYQYQIPDGLLVDGGEGTFILKDGTNVGSWVVTDTGLITLDFNEHMNSRTEITISATLGIHFPELEDPIDFDGKISVVIHPPPEELETTIISKWGIQGHEDLDRKKDPSKIYWNVYIYGRADSQIPGSILTDRIVTGDWIGNQHYTQSDMEQGLRFGAASPDGQWHNWTIYPGDPNLNWTENGWSYRIPETVHCDICGELVLGNQYWEYYVDYSSTPDTVNMAGSLYYMNRVSIDNQYADGGANFAHGEVLGEVHKNGTFVTDAGGGSFLWELQITIPGRKDGQKADYHWYIMDYMYLLNSDGYAVSPVRNDANLAMVIANYNGTLIQVPNVKDATPDDPFAWHNGWTAQNNGIDYGQEINLLCRCHCNEDNCLFKGNCDHYWYEDETGWHTNGFCQCWTEQSNVTFTFVYQTKDLSMVQAYGGHGYQLYNLAELYYKPKGDSEGARVSNDAATVRIPGLIDKQLTHDFNGYTANYKITINESKLVLTDGSPLTIHDVMTQSLTYISGSLVITAEDGAGNVTVLQQGVDFTVTYDGTGNATDQYGTPVHVLDIVILHPQPVKYLLNYDTTLIIPIGVTQGIKYSNSATISLWGEKVTDTSAEKVYADINIAAKNYKVKMFKTSSLTGEPLGGATFGLYNEHGGLISTEVTDQNGALLFQTNIIEGIILREHVLYYLQELRAPPGYQLDDTKHWFCFCDELTDTCETCDEVLAGLDAIRIPFEQIGNVNVTNDIMNYDLPATGGTGTYPLILVSVVFIITPLVYEFIRRRKRERRGVG